MKNQIDYQVMNCLNPNFNTAIFSFHLVGKLLTFANQVKWRQAKRETDKNETILACAKMNEYQINVWGDFL